MAISSNIFSSLCQMARSFGKRMKSLQLGKKAKRVGLGAGKGVVMGSKVTAAAGKGMQVAGVVTGREDLVKAGVNTENASRAARSVGRSSVLASRGKSNKARAQVEKALKQTEKTADNFA
ncbi:MAG: hypothetical protein ACR2ON_03260 [Paracoccaceae bacterium]